MPVGFLNQGLSKRNKNFSPQMQIFANKKVRGFASLAFLCLSVRMLWLWHPYLLTKVSSLRKSSSTANIQASGASLSARAHWRDWLIFCQLPWDLIARCLSSEKAYFTTRLRIQSIIRTATYTSCCFVSTKQRAWSMMQKCDGRFVHLGVPGRDLSF